MNLDELLRHAVAEEASDVHLSQGQPPVFRINGTLTRRGDQPLTADDMEQVVDQITPRDARRKLEEMGEVDFSFGVAGLSRFRVNVYRQRGALAVALRIIPFRIMSLAELGLPSTLETFCDLPHGLVIVTGPTGSGKSTTLAALIDLINERYSRHVITIEDPIEHLHRNKRSIVHQREVGSDTRTFGRALRAALRQDPDVILLGEIRDLDSIRIALQAAETGHLVFTTLHTNDAPSSVDRIIDVFPPEQQQQVRVQLAATLQGVVAQRLVPRIDRPGRVVAVEILLVNAAVRNLIREGKTHQLPSIIQTSGRTGMQSMAASLRELVRRGVISPEEAGQDSSL